MTFWERRDLNWNEGVVFGVQEFLILEIVTL